MLPYQSPYLLIIIFLITISICINPPIVTAQNGALNTRDDNNPPAAESPPYTGIIFIIFSGAIIILSFIIYYIRERCYFHRRSNLQQHQLPTWQESPQTSQPKGVDSTLLQTFPVFKYSQAAASLTIIIPDDYNNNQHQSREGHYNPHQECAVCLMVFEEKDELRLLPKCDHVFHKDCVDAWLIDHTTCPFCRADLLSQESAIDGKEAIKGGGGGGSSPAGKEASSTLTGQREVVISTGEDGPSRSELNRKEEEVNRPRPSQP